MKSLVTKLISLLLIAALVLGVPAVEKAYAGTIDGHKYDTHYSYSYSKGMLWWTEKGVTDVYRTSTSGYNVFYGPSSVSSGFDEHIYGDPSIVLEISSSMSLGSEDTYELNADFDLSEFDIPLSIGGSYAHTTSRTFTTGTSASRTVQKNAKTGYFSYNVMVNTNWYYTKSHENGVTNKYIVYNPVVGVRDPEPYRQMYYSPTANYEDSRATKMTESNKSSIFGIK